MARRSVGLMTGAQMAEQLLRIGILLAILPAALGMGLGEACGAVVLAGTVAELLSGLVIWQGYRHDLRKIQRGGKGKAASGVFRRLWRIGAPVAATRYVGSVLRTLTGPWKTLWCPPAWLFTLAAGTLLWNSSGP